MAVAIVDGTSRELCQPVFMTISGPCFSDHVPGCKCINFVFLTKS